MKSWSANASHPNRCPRRQPAAVAAAVVTF